MGLKTYTKRAVLAASTMTCKHPRLLEVVLGLKRNESQSVKRILDASVDANRVVYEYSAGPYLSGLESLNEVIDRRVGELKISTDGESRDVELFMGMLRCGPGNAYGFSECCKERREEELDRSVLVSEIKTLRFGKGVNFYLW
jgi:hypothetical protein